MPSTNKIIDLSALAYFKAKLDLILAGKADASAIPTVNNASLIIQKNGTTVETFYANDNTNKTANIVVPTATSDLTNDSDFQTGTEVSAAIAQAISGITGIEFVIVQALPATGETGIIYLVPSGGTVPDIYDEYVWIVNQGTGSFEKIGSTNIDLSGYVQFTDILYADNTDIDNLFV